MKLSTPRYTFCLISQFIFMFCDLIFNCVSLFPRSRDGLLVLFIFQDLFLILSLTTLLMTLFSTYLFQAGLVEVLIRKFRAAGSVILAYIAVNMVLHAVWLLEKWAQPESVSTPMLIVLFSLQRCLVSSETAAILMAAVKYIQKMAYLVSPWYYFFYKRAALRVSDPRFYEDIDWINQQMQTH